MRVFLPMMMIVMMAATGCAAPAPGNPPATGIPAVTQGALEITGAWARVAASMAAMATPAPGTPAMTGSRGNGGVYMTIRNNGSAAERLLGAASPAADAVEIHNTIKEGDVMKMRPVDGIDIPANGEASLAPGGYHIMLIGLKHDLRADSVISVTLRFAAAGEVALPVVVRQP